MSNGIAFLKDRKPETLEESRNKTYKASNEISDEERSEKGLHTPDFSESKQRGATVLIGEADSVLYLGQDERYGTTLTESGSGGDFSNKIVLGVGFLNEGKSDGDPINLESPDLRYGAGLTIYQKTDTGKDAVFDKSNPKNRDRKATTNAPQTGISVFEINADVVEVKARNGGVNIVAGFDPSLPRYGSKDRSERANTDYVGVKLIFGNPDLKKLNDPKSVFHLEPLVKGDKLENVLREINTQIQDLSKTVFQIQKNQQIFENVLAFHSHGSTLGLGPSPELIAGTYGIKLPFNIVNILQTITNAYNQAALKVNMSEVSVGGFKSQFNYTN